MIAHIVLFDPKPSLSDSEKRLFAQSVLAVTSRLPSVCRVSIGRKIAVDPGYGRTGRDGPRCQRVRHGHAGVAGRQLPTPVPGYAAARRCLMIPPRRERTSPAARARCFRRKSGVCAARRRGRRRRGRSAAVCRTARREAARSRPGRQCAAPRHAGRGATGVATASAPGETGRASRAGRRRSTSGGARRP